MSEQNLAQRIHAAYTTYRRLGSELWDAIVEIVGEERLEDAHVESDSQYDNSVEVALVGNARLTDEEREKIKALGFSIVWNDELCSRDNTAEIRAAADEARDEEARECAKIMCSQCFDGDPLEFTSFDGDPLEFTEQSGGYFRHRYEMFAVGCGANSIHRRIASRASERAGGGEVPAGEIQTEPSETHWLEPAIESGKRAARVLAAARAVDAIYMGDCDGEAVLRDVFANEPVTPAARFAELRSALAALDEGKR